MLELLELNTQTEQIIRGEETQTARPIKNSVKWIKKQQIRWAVQLLLFKYETGFHSDSSGNIISEIIVKADFAPLIIKRRHIWKMNTYLCTCLNV